MKHLTIFKASVVAALLVSASNVMAANPSATLQVKGTITPAACTPTFPNDGLVDYGATSTSQFAATGALRLDDKSIVLDIACTGPMKMSFTVVDNRKGTSVPGLTGWPAAADFGLGKTLDDKPIGAYALRFGNLTLDGNPAQLIESANGGSTFINTYITSVWPAETTDIASFADVGQLVPKAFTNASFEVFIDNINLANDMKTVTEVQNLDGNATLNFDYM
ncbi:DUF1120 domain-containing protein [Buttiauxella sp.]|uniref:DUF1120 domain-containing protein n=1 Tax=Buttiauxella sp. TaxID=1972222 RepID=UPI003C75767C